MLQNRTSLGEVWHKGIGYPGEHTTIVDASMFETAQVRLYANRVDRQRGTNAKEPTLLAGLVWDGLGRRMAPSHAVKAAKRYRYYISRIYDGAKDIPAWRVPAGDLEEAVSGQLRQALDDPAIQHQLLDQDAGDDGWVHLLRRTIARLQLQLRDGSGAEQRDIFLQLLRRVEIHKDRIDLQIDLAALIDGLEANGLDNSLGPRPQPYILSVPAQLVRAGKEVRLAIAPSYRGDTTRQDPALIKLIIKAHAARAVLKDATSDSLDTIAAEDGVSVDYFKVLVRLSYLAPDITSAILDGRQPATMTRQKLARFANLPIDWAAQRQVLGFI